jgi:hypothetical protein
MNQLEHIKIFGSSKEDELASYLNKLVLVVVTYSERPVVGKFVGLSESCISLQKRDGRVLRIRRKAINAIEPMKEVID